MHGSAVIVMGVSGSGKSTIGAALAERMGAPFLDADDLHSPASKAKMAAGTPLTDEDREPWLRTVGRRIGTEVQDAGIAVVACSALKRAYRDILRATAGVPLVFLHLDGSPGLVGDRLEHRAGHFMPPALLQSQLETLEPLEADEVGAVVPIDAGVAAVVERAVEALAGR